MNLEEMKRRHTELTGKLQTLLKKDKLTADEDGEIDKYIAEVNDLQPKIIAREAAAKIVEENSRSAGRFAGKESLADEDEHGEKLADKDKKQAPKSLAQRFTASDEFKRYQKNPTGKSERFSMPAPEPGEERYSVDGGPRERYDLVGGSQPRYLIPPQVVPGIFRPMDYALTMRDVLSSGRTNTDTIYFLRELAFTNNAAMVAQATATGGSSGTKPESALTFEQASAAVQTVAHWIPITRQALDDIAQIQSYIENRLQVGLERVINTQLLNGDGTGANILGILQTPGIQVADNTYFAGAPVENASTDNENFERILRAFTNVQLVGRANATFVTLNPRDLEKFMTVTDSTRQYMGGGPFSNGSVRTLWGRPIAVDEGITAGTALVGDGTMACVWDRYATALMLMDTINDQFIRNIVTLLCENRLALTTYRPAAFVNVTLAAWN